MKKFVENHKKEIKAFFFASLAVLFAGIVLESMSCSTSASVADSNSALQSSDSASGQTNLGSEVSTFNSDDTLDVTNYTWSGYTPNLSSRDITETDLVENASFSSEIYFNLADLSVSSDGVSFTPLEDGGSSVEASSIGLSLSNGLVTVTSSDTFKMNISGTANDSVAFYFSNKKGKDVSLVLNDAVFASGNYPCIEFAKKAKCYLVAKGSSYLTDGRNYGTNYASYGTGAFSEGLSSSKKGSVYVKG